MQKFLPHHVWHIGSNGRSIVKNSAITLRIFLERLKSENLNAPACLKTGYFF